VLLTTGFPALFLLCLPRAQSRRMSAYQDAKRVGPPLLSLHDRECAEVKAVLAPALPSVMLDLILSFLPKRKEESSEPAPPCPSVLTVRVVLLCCAVVWCSC
jgi:hypothetical protein